MKEIEYIKEFESRYSGNRDKSKKMDIYPPPDSAYPLVVEYSGKDIGCVYLHYEREFINPMVWIMYLRSYDQGEGYGKKILNELCSLADKYNVVLYLEPVPDRGSDLTHGDLVAWYRKFGFSGQHTMEREPNA